MDIKSRVPGKIEEICVKAGDAVKKGDKLYVVEAMKMLQEVLCPTDGTVKSVAAAAGDRVKSGAVIMTVE